MSHMFRGFGNFFADTDDEEDDDVVVVPEHRHVPRQRQLTGGGRRQMVQHRPAADHGTDSVFIHNSGTQNLNGVMNNTGYISGNGNGTVCFYGTDFRGRRLRI